MKKRSDPYRNFKFRIRWNGRTVAAFRKASGLTRAEQNQQERAAGEAAGQFKSRDWTAYEAITFERGVTHDPEFEQWANSLVDNYSAPGGVSLRDLRRDLGIEQIDESGQPTLTLKVYRCWVSDYQAMPDLDASSNAIAIQTIVIQNEGWERDSDIPEPTEPG
jgi:phage tail-like protein